MALIDDIVFLIGSAARDEQDGRDAAREIIALVRDQSFRPPPRRAVEKIVRRFHRMEATGITAEDLALPRGSIPSLDERAPFARELGYVLRDYEKLLDQLSDFYAIEE